MICMNMRKILKLALWQAGNLIPVNMYAEQNSGIYPKWSDMAGFGMNMDVLKCIKKHNAKIITVSDVHCPEDVGSKISELNRPIFDA